MIESEHDKDRLVVKKRNFKVSKPVELEMEKQRLAMGLITQIRRPLIDKIHRPDYIPRVGQ